MSLSREQDSYCCFLLYNLESSLRRERADGLARQSVAYSAPERLGRMTPGGVAGD